ncbi:NAD(P)H-hydrate dehydratase [Patescibacteria group bacterium]|nr:MAG: NAD(P)H-hydrate dehydratase [Patescibacteria group bacterium]
MIKIDKNWLKKLYQPPRKSRKGENGIVLIAAGSEKYHGSLILCATMAAKLVDLVYVYASKENFALIKKLREGLAEFIRVEERDPDSVGMTVWNSDAILLGPGLMPNEKTKKLVNGILRAFPEKKIVLDAGALRVVDLKLLHKNCVLAPHAGEFQAMFKKKATAQNARLISKKYPGVIVLKGWQSYVCQNGKVWCNVIGNQGMTKGGTGDVLSGLIVGLLAKNEPLLAAGAGLYANGAAGDALWKKFGFNYSASELVDEVRKVLAQSF